MTRQHMGVVFGGILLLVVAMGISRFAFTPILPFMRHDVGFSLEVAGFLASSNYIGYFIGALWAGFIHRRRKNILLASVVFNVLSVGLMGLLEVYSVWLVLRLIAGITGGLIFVLTSSIMMDYLARHSLSRWSGYVFSGIGLGIAISGLCVPAIEVKFAWEGTWLGLGMLSAIFLLITFILWRNLEVQDSIKVTKTPDTKMTRGFMPWLILSYGLEGLGYIITGTFLVDIIHNIPSLQAYSSYSWVIVGLAAIPSAPVWTVLLEKFSAIKILFVAYILQVIGILLPVFSQTVWSVLLASFLFGLTFVGIVTLTTSYARQLFPTQSGFVVSLLTTFYAFGQIIGPIVAGKLVEVYSSYKAALVFAGVIVFLALLVMVIGRWLTVKKEAAAEHTISI
ncbi:MULTISPECIES: YbfB/YjiJ family MFS transporter [unclassified Lysinibacillus]|uniref:YbfB/YjiJ family MFS transporter n=1 Tax=unclassified Lysinibacillus TaxID=2636778 RepID=UPI0007386EA5|nr:MULTISPECIES: YbfB/YjiJ family MFS transporter [unclassified Lysinibacillus]KUF36695.1 MFS transporter [Lysinibacillus sp. F5]SCX92407.1 Predicted arabinose efflux permease, MFS family [Lysinibacillus sp. SG9]SDB06724.1 Predicted arabinose efflux permease, MFS family [Lysinibacillus sp. TC-37]SFS38341.1 Predicted arabinose efflux permease, MFS family [Lysinibacillus sp. SG55]